MVSKRRPQSRQLTQVQYWLAPRLTCACWQPSDLVTAGAEHDLDGVGVGGVGLALGCGAGGGRADDEDGKPDTYVP